MIVPSVALVKRMNQQIGIVTHPAASCTSVMIAHNLNIGGVLNNNKEIWLGLSVFPKYQGKCLRHTF